MRGFLIAAVMAAMVTLPVIVDAGVATTPQIEHIVVLMLENRPFDHMLGWLNQWLGPNKVDGLTGNEFNIANGTKYYVQDQCPYVHPFDPLHDLKNVTYEIMGSQQWVDPAPMSGFAQIHFEDNVPEYWTVMHGFAPGLVPAISTLAENFAVFDKYYSSLPGPTYPNRMFWHSGTSHGMTANSILDYLPGQPQRTMMDVFNDHNISWAVYYQDVADTILFKTMRELENLERLHPYAEFSAAVAAGTLPTYSWVTPQFFPTETSPARDQHPDHDVVLGEEVIAEVYGILRNSSLWNKTAFIVTYDEHGGFYDHVSPPATNIPNPDGINGVKDHFNFTRLGMRVPMIVASPWVPRGLVVSEPEIAGTHYEHSSGFATFRKMLGIDDELTNRTAWAAPFDHVFSESAPRTDCPETIPTPFYTPQQRAAMLEDQKRRKPNGLQRQFYAVMEAALGRKEITQGVHIATQLEMGKEMDSMMRELKSRVNP